MLTGVWNAAPAPTTAPHPPSALRPAWDAPPILFSHGSKEKKMLPADATAAEKK